MLKKLLLLSSIGLVSCTNLPKAADESVTATEEVTQTALTEPVPNAEEEEKLIGEGARKEITLKKTKIGPFKCEYEASFYTDNLQDTSFYVFIIFDNFKYDYIHDTAIRLFSVEDRKSPDLLEFADYIDSAKTTRGQDVTWKYIIRTYDFTNDISIQDGDGRYNYLTLSQATKMCAWIRSLGITK
jgi:hypothetical protein